MEPSRKEDEERALAFAGLAMIKAVIDGLEKKGLLDDGEIQGIFDSALTSLELRHQDPAIGLARRIVEGAAVSRTMKWDDSGS